MAQAGGAQPYTSEDAEKRQHFFDSLVSETSLQEHLMRQAELSDCPPRRSTRCATSSAASTTAAFSPPRPPTSPCMSGLPLEAVQEAQKLLKTFDPPGIGAQNLAECLLAQLEAKGRGDSLAARIVRDHFELLTRRRIPELARRLGASVDDIQAAIEEIGTLDPAPGRRFADDSNRVVVPDVTVEKDGDEWKIHLNSDYIPRLRICQTYRDLIAKGRFPRTERDYLRERMRSGKFLIDSIEQRQRTIERITREIIKAQEDFFEHGVAQLKPLTMTQIADIVGVHETTVSRAIANKYIKTPHGVFDFKYFFTPGYQADSGAAVSNTSVKEMIADLIAAEDKAAPVERPGARGQAAGQGHQHRPPHGGQIPRGARHPAEQPAPGYSDECRVRTAGGRPWMSSRARLGSIASGCARRRAARRIAPRGEGDHAGVVAGVPRPRGEERNARARASAASAARSAALLATPPDTPRLRKPPRASAAAVFFDRARRSPPAGSSHRGRPSAPSPRRAHLLHE